MRGLQAPLLVGDDEEVPIEESELNLCVSLQLIPKGRKSRAAEREAKNYSLSEYLEHLKFEQLKTEVRSSHAALHHQMNDAATRFFSGPAEIPAAKPTRCCGCLFAMCPNRDEKKRGRAKGVKKRKWFSLFCGFFLYGAWPLLSKGICAAQLKRKTIPMFWGLVLAILYWPIPFVIMGSPIVYFWRLYPKTRDSPTLEEVNVFEGLAPAVMYIIIAIAYSLVHAFPAHHDSQIQDMPVVLRDVKSKTKLGFEHLRSLQEKLSVQARVSYDDGRNVNATVAGSVYFLLLVYTAVQAVFPFWYRGSICGQDACEWDSNWVVWTNAFAGSILMYCCYMMLWRGFIWAEFIRVAIADFTFLSSPMKRVRHTTRCMQISKMLELHQGATHNSGAVLNFIDLTIHQNVLAWIQLREALLRYASERRLRRISVIVHFALLGLVGIVVYQTVGLVNQESWDRRGSKIWMLMVLFVVTIFFLGILYKAMQINTLLQQHKLLLKQIKIVILERQIALQTLEKLQEVVRAVVEPQQQPDISFANRLVAEVNTARLYLRSTFEEAPESEPRLLDAPFISGATEIVLECFDLVLEKQNAPGGNASGGLHPLYLAVALEKDRLLDLISFLEDVLRLNYPSFLELQASEKSVESYLSQIELTDKYIQVMGVKVDMVALTVIFLALLVSLVVAIARVV